MHIDARLYFVCGSSAPVRVECEGGTAAWLVGTLVESSVQGHGRLHCRSYGPIRGFFQASCSWRSEGLFGQSFSIALPVRAVRGLPCLESFSVVQSIRNIEACPLAGLLLCRSAHQAHGGAPWVGSYSVDQRVRHLKGHPGWGPTL